MFGCSPNIRNEDINQSRIVISISPEKVGYGVPDSYFRHQLSAFAFHVGVRDIKNCPCSFYAVFNLTFMDFLKGEVLVILSKPRDLDVSFPYGCHGRKKELMPIRVVDISDDRKRMYGERWKGITIRLYRIGYGEQYLADWLVSSSAGGIGRTIPNRQRQFSRPSGDSAGESVRDQRPKSVIQSAPEVMDDIRDDERPADDRRLMVNPDDNTRAGVLGINVSEETIGFGCLPSQNFTAEAIEQFFGPPNLPVGARLIERHGSMQIRF